MSTYLEVKNSILQDLFPSGSIASSNGLDTAVSRAILYAVKFYENDQFWFNQASTAITTVVNQFAYTLPSLFLKEDSVRINYSNYATELKPRTLSWFQSHRNNINDTGIPTYYSIYNNQIYFYLIPNGVYTASIDFLTKLSQLPGSSGGSSTNAWLSDAEELIKVRSKIKVAENYTRDYDYGRVLRLEEFEIKAMLDKRTIRIRSTGEIEGNL